MKYFLGFLFCVLSIVATSGQITFQSFASQITDPVDIEHASDGSKRLFIVKKAGEIIVLDSLGNDLGTFLDIRSKVGNAGGERGLLGLAFHPDFNSNGYFFVNYTSTVNGDQSIIERYQASPPSANQASGNGVPVLSFTQPHGNHNGGDLAFSPIDGYLYIPTGDGGSGNDPRERAQDLTSPHGKILRLDVGDFSSTPPYRIPPDNPFGTARYTSEFQDTVNEIWAWGLRNPWRFYITSTGDFWIADVGQEKWEEVNYVAASDNVPGLNFGWDCKEGLDICGGCDPGDCSGNEYIDPIHQYDLSRQSITGGVVMDGPHYPSMPGAYLFAEYVHDQMWALSQAGSGRTVTVTELGNPPRSVSSFGKDEDGRIYVASMSSNTIYRVVDEGVLPIELVEVKINRHEKTNLLEWQTSMEINASHFEIERSRGPGAFIQIGMVPTRGTEGSLTEYRFPDVVEQPGHYFYRLKAIDQDGSYSYSMMLDIRVGQVSDLLLTPNPATSTVTVTFPNSWTEGDLILTSLSGKLLFRQRIAPSEELQELTIDVQDFNRGLVLVHYTTGADEYTKKLMLYR